MERITVSLVGAPLVFAAAAYFTRAPGRRLAAALLGAAAFAAGNVAWDRLGFDAGWWRYPDFGARAPLLWYGAAGLASTGIGLVGWRVLRRYGGRGLLRFLGVFTIFGAIRDFSVAHGAQPAIITFGPGVTPWLADAAGWLSLMAVVMLVQMVLGGEVGRLRGGGQ